jgi:hypothetical protein
MEARDLLDDLTEGACSGLTPHLPRRAACGRPRADQAGSVRLTLAETWSAVVESPGGAWSVVCTLAYRRTRP